MDIPANQMTVLDTRIVGPPGGLTEIRVEVQWSESDLGVRFFHVRHNHAPPCVSEAIEAPILHAISEGKQSMTGHVSLPTGTEVILEVWSNVGIEATDWSLDLIQR